MKPTIFLAFVLYVTYTSQSIIRTPLLYDLMRNWTSKCRDESLFNCRKFQRCCETNGKKVCAKEGGMLEYTDCNNYEEHGYDKEKHGICACRSKRILVDHKPDCDSDDQKEDCRAFAKCCKRADAGYCATYETGFLELPICEVLMQNFSHAEAVCRCAIDPKKAERIPGATVPEIRTTANVNKTEGASKKESKATDAIEVTSTAPENANATVSGFETNTTVDPIGKPQPGDRTSVGAKDAFEPMMVASVALIIVVGVVAW